MHIIVNTESYRSLSQFSAFVLLSYLKNYTYFSCLDFKLFLSSIDSIFQCILVYITFEGVFNHLIVLFINNKKSIVYEMSSIDMSTNSVPSNLQFIESSQKFISQNYLWLKTNYKFPTDTITDLHICRSRFPSNDLILVLCLAILWTVFRFAATERLFKVTLLLTPTCL